MNKCPWLWFPQSFFVFPSLFVWAFLTGEGTEWQKKAQKQLKLKKLQTYCLIFVSFLDYGFHTIMSQQGWVEASLTALCHQLWRVLLITFYPWDKTSLQILERTYTFFSGVSIFQPVFAKIGSSRNELPDLSRERIISIYLWQIDSRCCLKCKLCC